MSAGSPGDRPFLSIGEVLDLLKEHYADITISKIRFLESQGLLDPERTPSGYRKFYEVDVARLRWILEQQREHFLPLKVIKERIMAGAQTGREPESGPVASPGAEVASAVAIALASNGVMPVGPSPLDVGLSSVSLTLAELTAATGLDAGRIHELERYGLLVGRPVAGQIYFDEEALIVARYAAILARHGVEARHLRMYKTAAEREATTYEQVVAPVVKQRNPLARSQARKTLDEMTRAGEGLRAAFLRAALRDYTE